MARLVHNQNDISGSLAAAVAVVAAVEKAARDLRSVRGYFTMVPIAKGDAARVSAVTNQTMPIRKGKGVVFWIYSPTLHSPNNRNDHSNSTGRPLRTRTGKIKKKHKRNRVILPCFKMKNRQKLRRLRSLFHE